MALNAGVDLLVFSNVKSRDTDLGVEAARDHRQRRARRAHPACADRGCL